jgi:hypothetical protein
VMSRTETRQTRRVVLRVPMTAAVLVDEDVAVVDAGAAGRVPRTPPIPVRHLNPR